MPSLHLRRPFVRGSFAALSLIFAGIAFLAPAAAAKPVVDPTLNAVWQQAPPVVDGDLADWVGVQQYPLNSQNASAPAPGLRPEPSDLSAWTAIKWTSDNLYIALSVTDNIVERAHRNWLLDDMAQFTFDVDNSQSASLGDIFLTISPDGMITNGGLLPLGFEVRTSKTATGWQAEVLIPLREFGAEFLTDAQVGFTWGVQDNDGRGIEGSLVWAGTEFHSPGAQQGSMSFVNGPTREWIVVRPGVNGYDGITDTTLNSWPGNETKNFGPSQVMTIRGNLQWHLAFKFVPPEMPAGAKALRARIHMTVKTRNNTGATTAKMYRLLRPWDENAATWMNAAAATPWAIKGANSVGVDRGATVVAQTKLNIAAGEVVWEIGPDVISDLYANPGANHGFLFRGEDGSNVLYDLHSSECTGVANCTPWVEVFIEKPPPTAAGASLTLTSDTLP